MPQRLLNEWRYVKHVANYDLKQGKQSEVSVKAQQTIVGLEASLKFNPANYRILSGDEGMAQMASNFSKSVVVKASSPLPAVWKVEKLHSFHEKSGTFQAEIPIKEVELNAEEKKEQSEEVKTESE